MRRPLALLAFQLGVAVCITYQNGWLLVPVALAPVLLLDRRLFRVLLHRRLLLFLALMVVGVPALIGTKTASFMGVPYSPEYLRASLVMVLRCMVILLALRLFTSRLSLVELAERVRHTRFRQFGEAFILATELLPRFRATATQAYAEFRTGLPARNLLHHTASWTVELIARVLVDAEQYHLQRSGPARLEEGLR
jgi:hypothetical protein